MAAPVRRRGPAPRFTEQQVVGAAVAVAAAGGFGALSLRSVARHLGVSPMTLYTYVESSEQLAGLVIDQLVEEAVRTVRWPRSWQAVLRLFAGRLDALVVAHPAIVDAYGRGIVRSDQARRVADAVCERLAADGLTPREAHAAYLGVHALVLGHAVIRSGFKASPAEDRRMGDVPLAPLLDVFIAGLEARSCPT